MRRPFLNSVRLIDGMSLAHELTTFDSTFYLQKKGVMLEVLCRRCHGQKDSPISLKKTKTAKMLPF